MTTYSVAVVGTGPDPENPSVEGFAMGYRHAEAFASDDRCDLVGCADIVEANREAFADTFDLPAGTAYADYEAMLADLEPDVVSVAVPPQIHESIVVGCARSEVVDAIHCEKPMADTWGGAQRMTQAAWRHDVQLTFNRQRRFARPFTAAKDLLDDGAIGDLERVEIGWGDFFDTGAHTVDLAGMFAGDVPAEWVLAGLDYRDEDVRFGAHQENQMWAQWRYENGVYGASSTGKGTDFVGATMRLRGSEGELVVDADDGPMLELRQGGDRREIGVDGEGIHRTNTEAEDRFGSHFHDRAVAEIIDSLETDTDSTLSARLGLNTAEILFSGYESVRRRGRVDLPLAIDDHPLEAMVDAGDITPNGTDD